MTDKEIAKEIAQTILAQCGGINLAYAGWHKGIILPAYTNGIRGGVRGLIGNCATEKYVVCEIRLNVLDLYDVTILTLDGEVIKEYNGAYADQIGELVANASLICDEVAA